MNRDDQKKITRNLVALRKSMQNDVEAIADRLREVGCISKDSRNEIANVRPNIAQLKCGVLINRLLRSGPDAYSKFVKVLKDMGYSEVVDLMEKSVVAGSQVEDSKRQVDREKTFVIKNPMISERLRVPAANTNPKVSGGGHGQSQGHSDNEVDEVRQLERMMTIVLTGMENRDSHKNKAEFKRNFKQRLHEESKGNEQLMGFFKTLRYNSFALTSQSLTH